VSGSCEHGNEPADSIKIVGSFQPAEQLLRTVSCIVSYKTSTIWSVCHDGNFREMPGTGELCVHYLNTFHIPILSLYKDWALLTW
jgi:hypothetical protein